MKSRAFVRRSFTGGPPQVVRDRSGPLLLSEAAWIGIRAGDSGSERRAVGGYVKSGSLSQRDGFLLFRLLDLFPGSEVWADEG